jgi:hypothetical protein
MLSGCCGCLWIVEILNELSRLYFGYFCIIILRFRSCGTSRSTVVCHEISEAPCSSLADITFVFMNQLAVPGFSIVKRRQIWENRHANLVSEEQGFLLKMPASCYALHGPADDWMHQLHIPILCKSPQLRVWRLLLVLRYFTNYSCNQ